MERDLAALFCFASTHRSEDKKGLIKDPENGMKKSASKNSVAKDSAV